MRFGKEARFGLVGLMRPNCFLHGTSQDSSSCVSLWFDTCNYFLCSAFLVKVRVLTGDSRLAHIIILRHWDGKINNQRRLWNKRRMYCTLVLSIQLVRAVELGLEPAPRTIAHRDPSSWTRTYLLLLIDGNSQRQMVTPAVFVFFFWGLSAIV